MKSFISTADSASTPAVTNPSRTSSVALCWRTTFRNRLVSPLSFSFSRALNPLM
jgi:hypothetical protein